MRRLEPRDQALAIGVLDRHEADERMGLVDLVPDLAFEPLRAAAVSVQRVAPVAGLGLQAEQHPVQQREALRLGVEQGGATQ
ncbi:hypothetical protein ABE85_06675 [Mitsuaria sp. 7]|nr:hypothetical protein ABE85_06675 [Mitsuaria sp. 7]